MTGNQPVSCVCIGGQMHGKQVTLDGRPPYFARFVDHSIATSISGPPANPHLIVDMPKREIYCPLRLVSGAREYFVYLLADE